MRVQLTLVLCNAMWRLSPLYEQVHFGIVCEILLHEAKTQKTARKYPGLGSLMRTISNSFTLTEQGHIRLSQLCPASSLHQPTLLKVIVVQGEVNQVQRCCGLNV